MECLKCGLTIGSHQVHFPDQCDKQQEINRINKGESCVWCGGRFNHKENCPRNKACNKQSDSDYWKDSWFRRQLVKFCERSLKR